MRLSPPRQRPHDADDPDRGPDRPARGGGCRHGVDLEALVETFERAQHFRLVASADVLVQNLRPGALAKVGLDAERLRQLNPRLVYCEMSGLGRTGPEAADPAYDPLLQAYSGIVDMVSGGDGPPVRVPLSVLDKDAGRWVVVGILDALRRRDTTGVGSHVEVSLLQRPRRRGSTPR